MNTRELAAKVDAQLATRPDEYVYGLVIADVSAWSDFDPWTWLMAEVDKAEAVVIPPLTVDEIR